MADNSTTALVAAGGSLIVAILSGLIALWNGNKTNANSLDIQNLKGVIDEDLEKLKAKLLHGQTVSSTQWNAEFTSYQAIWKGMVALRTLAQRLVVRESEIVNLGLPSEFLGSVDRVGMRKELIGDLVDASQCLLLAIHDNGPFYPAPIRETANRAQGAAKQLVDIHLNAMIKGLDVQTREFIEQSKTPFLTIIEDADRVESLIRDRLAAVEVVSGVSV